MVNAKPVGFAFVKSRLTRDRICGCGRLQRSDDRVEAEGGVYTDARVAEGALTFGCKIVQSL